MASGRFSVRHFGGLFFVLTLSGLGACVPQATSGGAADAAPPAPPPPPSPPPSPPPAPPPAPFSVNSTSGSFEPGSSQSFTVSGGTTPYTWSITSGAGNLSAATGSTSTYSSSTSENAQVAVQDAAGASLNIPVRVSRLVSQVSVYAWIGCAVLVNGSADCWGYDLDGRLGDGGTTSQYTPVPVQTLTSGVTQITYGAGFGCALMQDHTVKCWGIDGYGSLGDGGSAQNNTPTAVAGITDAVEIASGSYNMCVRLGSGGVQCWGYNGHGQVGNGSTAQRNTPYTLPGITNAISLAAGQNNTCVVLADHTVQCWGGNGCGEVGKDTSGADQTTPSPVTGLSNASKVVVGDHHACALLTDGTMSCWGRGDSGQLGNGSTTTINTSPIAVPGLSNISLIAAGGGMTCAVVPSGLKCWGFNGSGALGLGVGSASQYNTPQDVSLPGPVTSIAIGTSGFGAPVAAVVGGQVYTWGLNDQGQAANGSSGTNVLSPALASPF